MKLKVKLDAKTLQQSLVEHAEKAVFGLVVLCFLFFVYRAIARDKPVKFTAEELDTEAKQAEKHLADSKSEAPTVVRVGDRAARMESLQHL